MSSSATREKLYDDIKVADEKKVKAIYNLLQEDIEETTAWWKDAAVVKDFDNRYNNWKAGKEKAYSIKETASYIKQLKKAVVKK